MSRIGKLPISIPAGVTVAQDKDGVVTVKGPKGELSQKVDKSIIVKIEDGHVTFEVDENSPVNYKQKQAFHGLYRALVNNMVVGVSEGYKKEMELVGVGYRVSNQGNIIEFALGYTHPIFIQLPKEVKVETLTPSSSSFLRRLRLRQSLSVTRILRLSSSLATSSSSDLFVLKFVLSASLSLIKERVSCSRVRLSVVSRVSQHQLSN